MIPLIEQRDEKIKDLNKETLDSGSPIQVGAFGKPGAVQPLPRSQSKAP
jgi:hypothetical protein